MQVHLVCDMDMRRGFYGTRINWGRRGYSARHMIIRFMETVVFNDRLRF